ncbi:MAG TPA: hypothetical protein VEI45_00650 [Mycobacterium sp.]|uniref:hypothetical protein n=1 Tax=Mycobacterium sp. TaxID=1785 RepID=UPI002D608E5D|nr:hypothetical protein [Mycobacterium sp.]HXY62887.1 hypothetical protein [Mycobacterium sp.]
MTWDDHVRARVLEGLAETFGRVLCSAAAAQKLIFVREVPIVGQRHSPRGGVPPRSVIDGSLSP